MTADKLPAQTAADRNHRGAGAEPRGAGHTGVIALCAPREGGPRAGDYRQAQGFLRSWNCHPAYGRADLAAEQSSALPVPAPGERGGPGPRAPEEAPTSRTEALPELVARLQGLASELAQHLGRRPDNVSSVNLEAALHSLHRVLVTLRDLDGTGPVRTMNPERVAEASSVAAGAHARPGPAAPSQAAWRLTGREVVTFGPTDRSAHGVQR